MTSSTKRRLTYFSMAAILFGIGAITFMKLAVPPAPEARGVAEDVRTVTDEAVVIDEKDVHGEPSATSHLFASTGQGEDADVPGAHDHHAHGTHHHGHGHGAHHPEIARSSTEKPADQRVDGADKKDASSKKTESESIVEKKLSAEQRNISWRGALRPELTKRSHEIRVPERFKSSKNFRVGEVLTFDLFDGDQVTAKVNKSFTNVNGTVSTTAHIEDSKLGRMFLASTDGVVLGRIVDYENRTLHLIEYNSNDKSYYLLERDFHEEINVIGDIIVRFAEDDPIALSTADSLRQPESEAISSMERVGDSSGTMNKIMDVSIVWTQNCQTSYGTTSMTNWIANCIASMNDINANSQTGLEWNLVHSANTGFTEAGDLLDQLTNPSDGVMDTVHTWRDESNADFVQLIRMGGGGVAWISTSDTRMFSVAGVSGLSSGIVSAHEFGHNQGLHHAYDQNFQAGYQNSYQNGWHWHTNGDHDTNGWCTILSYTAAQYFDNHAGSHTRVPYYSDPDVIHSSGQAQGDALLGDSVRWLRENQLLYIGHRSGNHTPVITTNNTLNVNEGAVGVIGTSLLDSGDPDYDLGDNIAANRRFTITTPVANGTLFLDANGNTIVDGGEALGLSDTFTQQDVDDNKIKFVSDVPYGGSGSESFIFDLKDDDPSNPLGPENQTFNITVTTGVVGVLQTPTNGSTTLTDLGYVDILWVDSSGSGIKTSTIDANDVTITGVTVTGATNQGGNVWRYAYSGSLVDGRVDVNVVPSQVQNNNNSWNIEGVYYFNYDNLGPRVIDFSAGKSAVVLTFNEAVDTATFNAADDISTFTGPSGNITVTGTAWSAGNTVLTLTHATQVAGNFQLVLGPNINDPIGNAMNQDQDLVNGEATQDQYSVSYQLSDGNIYFSDLESNPGFTATGGWEWGTPTATVSTGHSNRPSSAYSGTKIYDLDLNDTWRNTSGAELTSVVIDCSGYTDVNLEFYNYIYLYTEWYFKVEVYDGSTWNQVHLQNGGNTGSWNINTRDIAQYANDNANMQIRWSVYWNDDNSSGGYTYYYGQGMGIDDVKVTGTLLTVSTGPGNLKFAQANFDKTEGDAGSSTATVTVSRVDGSTGAASVMVSTANGTATTADNDYVAVSNQILSWANGESGNKTFTVTVNGDTKVESDETINLALSNFSGATEGTQSSATITILNDDAITLVTDVASVDVNEGSTNTFQVKLSNQPSEAVNVTVARASGDGDISVTGGANLSFSTGDWNTYKTVTLTAAEDADTASGAAVIRCTATGGSTDTADVDANELDDDFTLTVNSTAGGTTNPSGATIIDSNDDLPYAVSASAGIGYSFTNWTDSSNVLTNASVAATTVKAGTSADCTITANFTGNTYTVTLDDQGGTGGSGTVDAIYGSAMPAASVPTKSGLAFAGYFAQVSGGGTKYYNADMSSANNWNVASDTTIYAHWTLLPEIDVTRTGLAIVDGGADSNVSGSYAAIGRDLNYVIANTGGADLTLGTATTANETNCAVNIVQPGTTVTAGGNTTMLLTVTPGSAGNWSFTVSIPTSDTDEDPYNWTVSGTAGSTTVAINGTIDTFIDQAAQNTPHGGLEYLDAYIKSPNSDRIGLIKFDLFSIPPGTSISAASVTFYTYGGGGTAAVDICNANSSNWNAGALWNGQSGIPVTGTVYGTSASVNTGSIGTPVPITLNAAGRTIVEGWCGVPEANTTGFSIFTGNNSKLLRLCSHDYPTTTNDYRPVLSITYTPPIVPEMKVSGRGQVIVDGDTTPDVADDTAFGTTPDPITRTFTIHNLGTGALSLDGTPDTVQITTVGTDFTISAQPATSVAADGTVTFDVTFTPSAQSGEQTAEIFISNSDSSTGNDYTFLVSATGDSGPGATVTNTEIFYNNSAWDGGDAGASAADNDAIASTKSALLPGGTATFANYTSYDKGINGIMIDVTGSLPATLDKATDFEFRIGNDNDPTGWTLLAGADLPSVTVTADGGGAGVDRITLIWLEANAPKKTWLQVRVLASGNVGLTSDYVFYYGNAIGEVGNSATDALVNASDVLGMRANPKAIGTATLDDVYDCNRDKAVNATDVLRSRSNATTTADMLQLITVP